MDYLGRQLEAMMGGNATNGGPPPMPIPITRARRASSAESAEEAGRESGFLSSMPSGWEDLGPSTSTAVDEPEDGPNGLARFLPSALRWEEEETGTGSEDSAGRRLRRYLATVRYHVAWPRHKATWDEDAPIWLLGKFYHARTVLSEPASPSIAPGAEILTPVDSVIQDFQQDFASRLWFTYRLILPFPHQGTKAQSDCGWGCMLRSGQMMVAQALVLHFLGREWSMYESQTLESIKYQRHIISLFGDSPVCPLSIHNLVEAGSREHGKSVGDWYGPGSVALVFRDLFQSSIVATHPSLSQFAVYVARDCAIYLDEIDALCREKASPSRRPDTSKYGFRESGPGDGTERDSFVRVERMLSLGAATGDQRTEEDTPWARALILFVPLRLGTQRLNPAYVGHIRTLLSLRHCLGLIGGKPRHSMYFVGFHKDSLVYLDPHLAQPYQDVTAGSFAVGSFHCHTPAKLPLAEADPSLALGFYVPSRSHLNSLLADLDGLVHTEDTDGATHGPQNPHRPQPLFSVLRRPRSPHPSEHRPTPASPSATAAALSHGFELL